MNKLKITVITSISFLFLFLSGCKNLPADVSDSRVLNINFYSASDSVTLNYKEPGSSKYTDAEMLKSGKNWWKAKITCSVPIHFKFSDGNGKVYNLGGTMGNYPSDPSEDFETSVSEIWVKNGLIFNYNPEFSKPSNELVVLTLNMHTYQETGQNGKFMLIADAVNQLNSDIIVLQECAQHRDSKVVETHYGKEIRSDNMALILVNMLQERFNKQYYFYWDWSHYGFDTFEEGTAILSKYKLTQTQSRYISRSHEKSFWKSRNVTMIQTDVPDMGKINVFSAHMGWWDDKEEPFSYMFDNLNEWIFSESQNADASFVCGDFNIAAGSEGYKYIMSTTKYLDAYFSANTEGFMDSTIGGKIDGWKDGDAEGKRIDYMFLLKGNRLSVDLSQRIFTEKSFGRVSDHCGVYFYLSK